MKEDEELRYAIAGLIGLEEIMKRFEQHGKELIKLRKDILEGFKRHVEEVTGLRAEIVQLRKDMLEGFKLLERHINTLGTRWGLLSEESFREGLREMLEKELELKVERWSYYDEEGVVYDYPSQVEVDVVVHSEKYF